VRASGGPLLLARQCPRKARKACCSVCRASLAATNCSGYLKSDTPKVFIVDDVINIEEMSKRRLRASFDNIINRLCRQENKI
jgi:hypothetical protein